MSWVTKTFVLLILLLHCGLEPDRQYFQGMPLYAPRFIFSIFAWTRRLLPYIGYCV